MVLTDGEVTNTDAVLALAARYAGEARIFTFGIGAGASHHLVRGLARAGGGGAEFIYPGERIEQKVVRQFRRLLSPALEKVTLEWLGGEVTQAPSSLSPIFPGGRLLVYGLVKGRRPTTVRLSAIGPSGPLSTEVPLDTVRPVAGRTVATLAARARIRELEEGREWLETRGSLQTDRKRSPVAAEIVDLSVRYGIVSRLTSFVAVERRDTPVHGERKLRRIPVALTAGWGGLDHRVEFSALPTRLRAHIDETVAASDPNASGPHLWAEPRPSFRDVARDFAALRALAETAAESRRRRVRAARRRPAGLDALVALQAADGSWDLTPRLAAIVGRCRTSRRRSPERQAIRRRLAAPGRPRSRSSGSSAMRPPSRTSGGCSRPRRANGSIEPRRPSRMDRRGSTRPGDICRLERRTGTGVDRAVRRARDAGTRSASTRPVPSAPRAGRRRAVPRGGTARRRAGRPAPRTAARRRASRRSRGPVPDRSPPAGGAVPR